MNMASNVRACESEIQIRTGKHTAVFEGHCFALTCEADSGFSPTRRELKSRRSTSHGKERINQPALMKSEVVSLDLALGATSAANALLEPRELPQCCLLRSKPLVEGSSIVPPPASPGERFTFPVKKLGELCASLPSDPHPRSVFRWTFM